MEADMNRYRSLTACALVAGLLAGGAAFAQAQGAPDGFRGRGPRAGGPGGFGGPGLALRELNLTDAQQEQIRSIREQHRDEVVQAETQVRGAMEAQRRAVETIPVDEGLIRSTTERLAEAQTSAAIARARVFSETWAVLTPAQQSQAKKLEAQREAKRQELGARPRQRPTN
jgi:Spy/CpxP family protein refolding chaperone